MIRLIHLPRACQHWIKRQWLLRSPSLHGRAPFEDREGLLEKEKGCTEQLTIRFIRLPRRIAIVGIATLVSLFLIAAYRSKSQPQLLQDKPIRRNAQLLHLVIPTLDLDPELCKTVLSAEILHYSTPTLIQWNNVAGEGLANVRRRTTAIRDHLGKLEESQGNDTVVLLDSVSTWFQLRPEVLLKRYYGIIHRENRRLAARIGAEVMQEEGIDQSVVFSASSTCGAAEERCSQVLESPLVHKSSRTTAPRYLGQGVVVGPMKGVYQMYRRAVAIIERSDDLHLSELEVFSEIFSSQEHHRGLLQSSTISRPQGFRDFSSNDTHGPLGVDNTTRPHKMNHANDFGIGLDYAGLLAFDTGSMSESYTWAKHATVPQDVLTSMPPFWTTTGQGLSAEKTWSDLVLFTNTRTHAIPAAVHHQDNVTNNHYARQKLWQQFWLSQHSRKLFDAYTTVPAMPIAAVINHEQAEQVSWSTTVGEKAGVKWSNGTWLGWNDLCKGEQLANEIFGDNLGEWTSPAL